MNASSQDPRGGGLIVMDGIDGCGKTTQVKLLFDRLTREGHSCVASREPTSGPWGQKLRQSAIQGRLDPAEELEVILNDRRDDVEKCIRPALEAGSIVILDRYYTSTLAYQTLRGLDPGVILSRNLEFAPPPDLIILLEIEISVALERIGGRGGGTDLFEDQNQLLKVSSQFASLNLPGITRINAAEPTASLHDRIYDAVCRKFHLSSGGQLLKP